MTDVAKDQPMPEAGKEIVLDKLITLIRIRHHQALIPDLEARAAKGRETYGTDLQTFNGRSALMDAYQETLDACMYLMQLHLEVDNYYTFSLLRQQLAVASSLKGLLESTEIKP